MLTTFEIKVSPLPQSPRPVFLSPPGSSSDTIPDDRLGMRLSSYRGDRLIQASPRCHRVVSGGLDGGLLEKEQAVLSLFPAAMLTYRLQDRATSSSGVCGSSRGDQGHPAKWSSPSGLSWAGQRRAQGPLLSAEVSPVSSSLSGLVDSGPGFQHTDLSPEAALRQHHSWRSLAFIWQSRVKSLEISDNTVQTFIIIWFSNWISLLYMCM